MHVMSYGDGQMNLAYCKTSDLACFDDTMQVVAMHAIMLCESD